jgi:hypothetical protein
MKLRTLLSTLTLLATISLSPVFAQDNEPPPLIGKVQGKTYISPTGAFKIEIPVLPELGGAVTDTETVVTFQDDFNVHASIACFEMDATNRWENETRGRRDYLVWFFGNYVESDFAQRFPGSKIESAKFIPAIQDGALLAFNLLPGGSMFEERVVLTGNEEPPTAKRGNLLFVKNEHVWVLSIELAEKVVERSTFKKTVDEENEILRKRLLDLLEKITFTPAPKKDK